jgi:acyl dehydratase
LFNTVTAVAAICVMNPCQRHVRVVDLVVRRRNHWPVICSVVSNNLSFRCATSTINDETAQKLTEQIGSGNDSYCDQNFYTESAGNCNVIRGTIPKMGNGLAVHQFAEMERSYSVDDVNRFATLVGDFNPIHRDWRNATNISENIQDHPLLQEIANSKVGHKSHDVDNLADESLESEDKDFSDVIVPGMLAGSIFAAIIGTLIPGAVYIQQTLDFRQPLFVDAKVIGRIVITKLRNFPRRNGLIMVCHTTVCTSTCSKLDSVDNSEKLHTGTSANDTDSQPILIRGQASVWLPSGIRKDIDCCVV